MEGIVLLLILCGLICWIWRISKAFKRKTRKTSIAQKGPKTTVTIETVKTPRPKKDASFEFCVLGSTCRVDYFSDWQYLTKIIDSDEYYHDPRRWVDVHFRGSTYGYAWNDGAWTQTAEILEEKDQIEYMICDHFGTLFNEIEPGSIITSNRQSFNGKYLFHGKAEGLIIAAEFKHGGYVVQMEINKDKGRYDSRNNELQIPVKYRPAAKAISGWVASEYFVLKPLKGILPSAEPT